MPSFTPDALPVKIRRSHLIVTSVIILGLIFMTLGIHFLKKHPRYYAHSLRTPQEADSVAGYPIAKSSGDNPEFWTAEFQPNLSQLSPMERFRLPVARHFNRPSAPTASAHGLVLYTGEPGGYPGKAVLLGHRLPDDTILQTLYAGLSSIAVRVGEQVARDESLGTLEDDLYFEIRQGPSIDVSSEEIAGISLNTPATKAPNRLDPDTFFQNYTDAPRSPDAFTILRKQELARRGSIENLQMDTGSALKLRERESE